MSLSSHNWDLSHKLTRSCGHDLLFSLNHCLDEFLDFTASSTIPKKTEFWTLFTMVQGLIPQGTTDDKVLWRVRDRKEDATYSARVAIFLCAQRSFINSWVSCLLGRKKRERLNNMSLSARVKNKRLQGRILPTNTCDTAKMCRQPCICRWVHCKEHDWRNATAEMSNGRPKYPVTISKLLASRFNSEHIARESRNLENQTWILIATDAYTLPTILILYFRVGRFFQANYKWKEWPAMWCRCEKDAKYRRSFEREFNLQNAYR